MSSELAGRTVVLTRDPADNAALAARLRRDGAEVIELPCVHVEPLADMRPLRDALAALGESDWLVLTSRHGADAVARCGPTRAAVAVIGRATAEQMRAYGLRVDFEPTAATGERLARELPELGGVALLARSDRALSDLPRILRARRFAVREVVAYRTVAEARGDIDRVRGLLAARERPVVVFHSPSALAGMLAAIDAALVTRASIQVGGRATLRAVHDALGLDADVSLIREEAADVAHR
ncbi:MAG TPA: uroporphyrinogen-III synthase [Candidatus Limnocylindria bacterium]|jgi:uroporphyrinogen-III synthase|nr:uroporphyrinogen-III synthase [Candidatus Limnocylindria bacterium]